MKIVTFAIPCYNVESCVGRCLDSILDAHLNDKIEILVVNDGSTDNTATVLQQYDEKYPGVLRVLNKENGGWGTAVNLAIREAEGKYLKEIDADDWVNTKNLPEYIQTLETLDVDYVATGYQEYQSKNDSYQPHPQNEALCNQVFDVKTFWDEHPTGWGFPIHAITYNTQFIRDINLTVGDRYYTDFEYFLKSMPYVRTLYIMNVDITIYYRGNEEQSTGTLGYAKHYGDMAALSLRLANFYEHLPLTIHPLILKSIQDTIAGNVALTYELMMSPIYAGKKKGISKELKAYDNELQKHPVFYDAMRRVKKKNIAYIKFWRSTGINLLKLHK